MVGYGEIVGIDYTVFELADTSPYEYEQIVTKAMEVGKCWNSVLDRNNYLDMGKDEASVFFDWTIAKYLKREVTKMRANRLALEGQYNQELVEQYGSRGKVFNRIYDSVNINDPRFHDEMLAMIIDRHIEEKKMKQR